MVFLKLKASDTQWFDFVEYTTIEDLIADMEKEKEDFIIGENLCDNIKKAKSKYWFNVESDYVANKIVGCKYAITIYDGYIE